MRFRIAVEKPLRLALEERTTAGEHVFRRDALPLSIMER